MHFNFFENYKLSITLIAIILLCGCNTRNFTPNINPKSYDDYLLGVTTKKNTKEVLYFYLKDGNIYSASTKSRFIDKPIGKYQDKSDSIHIEIDPHINYLYPNKLIAINTTIKGKAPLDTAQFYCKKDNGYASRSKLSECNSLIFVLIDNTYRCGRFPSKLDMTCMSKNRFSSFTGSVLNDISKYKSQAIEGKREVNELSKLAKSIATTYLKKKQILEGIILAADLSNINYLIGNDIAYEAYQSESFIRLITPPRENARLHARFHNNENLTFRSQVILNRMMLTDWAITNLQVFPATHEEPKASADSYANIFVDVEWLDSLSKEAAESVLKHEVVHIINNIVLEYEYSGLPSLEGLTYEDALGKQTFSSRSRTNVQDIVRSAVIEKALEKMTNQALEEVLADKLVILTNHLTLDKANSYCGLLASLDAGNNRVNACNSLSNLLSEYSGLYFGLDLLVNRGSMITGYSASSIKSLTQTQEERLKETNSKLAPIYLEMSNDLLQKMHSYDKIYSSHSNRNKSLKRARENYNNMIKELFK
ncbi:MULTISPECIES: hypothetical protein [Pseudoalteromonas]|uniref:Uncharacterized protein n=1 Tax=Pseudoalteromonas amylolytica TaxID=1859457 RepID=A0A1S1N2F9_9GAMM|nr:MULTISPECIES: hypothetical protein [Pseudoalteromonas]OHU90585.1 hypothetical protein BFC16_02980 [Pseudoalteromonas sp. JW3]OHU92794.1 hypothetical protein BET10_04915 [Pseudoalteromonas amylolytica]